MYKLVIPKSKSKNFKKAIGIAMDLGGDYIDDTIIIEVKEEMEAYEKLIPLFRLKVLNWKGTKAYHNDIEVDPYRFIFLAKQKKERNAREILSTIEKPKPNNTFTYYKREGNTFFFKNEFEKFNTTYSGKQLFEFVDQFNIGDKVVFND